MKGSAWHIMLGILVLIFMSPVDWPLMLPKEPLPHWPKPDEWESDVDREGKPRGLYHHGKGFWTSLVRADEEYWTKFCRFAIWWLVFAVCVQMIVQ